MDIKELLLANNQKALLNKWESLAEKEKKLLESDILSQDFELLDSLYKASLQETCVSETEDIQPIIFPHSENDLRREMWHATGMHLLKQGYAAAFTLAGGQGSRLGFEGPKGAYDFGLPSKRSLFALQAERLLRLSAEAERQIPWCIMTSPLNHQETIAHFEKNSFFGLDRNYVRFFPQGTIAALTKEGTPIVTKNNRLALVPDGNGGCFRALAKSGCLAWLVELGVRYVFLCNIDNALVRICDPVFLGALAANGKHEAIAKVVAKRDASEKVGIFVYKNKKPAVIEYTDMPEDLRELKDGENLVFDGANIGIYAFRIEALRKMQKTPLPWHTARKTVENIPDSLKFEQFIFDAFPALNSFATFGAYRDDEFSPIKNAEGNDSPQSAREMLGKLHKSWLIQAGVKLSNDKLYEISPSLSYAGEGLSKTIFERELGKNILEF
jgi:UDP-N-acetylglucosamine/UDP-N-acetylgalactosamine diphosphorylase